MQGPRGQLHACSFPTNSRYGDLVAEASRAFGVAATNIEVLLGFPPTLCSAAYDAQLSSIVRSRSALVVRERAAATPAAQAQTNSNAIIVHTPALAFAAAVAGSEDLRANERERTPPPRRPNREPVTPPRLNAFPQTEDVLISLRSCGPSSVKLCGTKLYELHKLVNIKTLHSTFEFRSGKVIGSSEASCWRSDDAPYSIDQVMARTGPQWIVDILAACQQKNWSCGIRFDLVDTLADCKRHLQNLEECLLLAFPPPKCPMHGCFLDLGISRQARSQGRKFWACPCSNEHLENTPTWWRFQWADERRIPSPAQTISTSASSGSVSVLGWGQNALRQWEATIDQAMSTIRVASFSLRYPSIIEALRRARGRGVRMWFLLDRKEIGISPVIQTLADVRFIQSDIRLHCKLLIADAHERRRARCVTGSANPSAFSENSIEDVVVFCGERACEEQLILTKADQFDVLYMSLYHVDRH